jgi:hypothetical protein
MWVCPECCGEAIDMRADIRATLQITDWDDNGEPIIFDTMVDWDFDDSFVPRDPPYICEECAHRFEKPKRMSDAEYDEYWRNVDSD